MWLKAETGGDGAASTCRGGDPRGASGKLTPLRANKDNALLRACLVSCRRWWRWLMAGYYVYNLIDADGVVRYVGKGIGRRIDSHLGVILALAAGAPAARASKVHRRFAADIQIGRQFRAAVVADGLSQADAYAMEAV
jgi:hypothetical protein